MKTEQKRRVTKRRSNHLAGGSPTPINKMTPLPPLLSSNKLLPHSSPTSLLSKSIRSVFSLLQFLTSPHLFSGQIQTNSLQFQPFQYSDFRPTMSSSTTSSFSISFPENRVVVSFSLSLSLLAMLDCFGSVININHFICILFESLKVLEWLGVVLQLGVGTVSVDFLAAVASYPNPDDKIRTTSLKVCVLLVSDMVEISVFFFCGCLSSCLVLCMICRFVHDERFNVD